MVLSESLKLCQIAIFNTDLSVKNFKAAMAVPAALGLDPHIANSGKSMRKFLHFTVGCLKHFSTVIRAVHRTINDTLSSILPSNVQRTILDGIFTIGRMQLSDSVLSESNPLGYLRLSKLRRIFEEGKSLQLQFPAEDLGFRCFPIFTSITFSKLSMYYHAEFKVFEFAEVFRQWVISPQYVIKKKSCS